MIYQTDRLNTL